MKRHFHRGITRCHSCCALGLLPLEPRRLLSIFYVDANAPGPEHDGLSWETAYTDLQDILPKAPAGSRILVAEGTYKPTQDADRTKSFVLRSGITLEGGYAGASDPSAERDISVHETILSGDIGDEFSTFDNSYHVVVASRTDPTAALDGLTISDGRADVFLGNNGVGGGLFNEGGQASIRNCTFRANWAHGGGAIRANNGGVLLSRCVFRENVASSSGGALSINECSVNLERCTFDSNIAASSGAVWVQSSTSTLVDCTFTDNAAPLSAGAIRANNGSLKLTNCAFLRNACSGSPGQGGAILSENVTLTLADCSFIENRAGSGGGVQAMNGVPGGSIRIVNCRFSNNVAQIHGGGLAISVSPVQPNPLSVDSCEFTGNTTLNNGGAVYCSGSGIVAGSPSPSFKNCTFNGNSAGQFGGAVFNNSSSPQFLNCTFTGNSAPTSESASGGAVYNVSSSPTFINCTFDANRANWRGGAFYNDSASIPTISNCILWNDAAPEGTEIFSESAAPAITYSNVRSGFAGEGNIDVEPLFARVPSAGGDSAWGTADDDYGDLHLQPDSPCIDAGDNSAVPGGLVTDFDGNPRIADTFGVHDPGRIVDMGAYEFTPTPAAIYGTDDTDHFFVHLATDPPLLEIWPHSTPTGPAAYSYDLRSLSTLTFDTGAGPDTITFDIPETSFPVPIHFGGDLITVTTADKLGLSFRSITLGGTMRLAEHTTLVLTLQSIFFETDGRLDLTDNTLVVSDGNLASLSNWLKSARAGSPRWTGPGIGTSSANADQGLAIEQLGPDVKIQFTWNGDLNLDGRVNADDYFFIDQGFLQKPQPPTYHDGDFNFDGKIDADDYFLIDQAFLNQRNVILQPARAISRPAERPEPSGLFGDVIVSEVWD